MYREIEREREREREKERQKVGERKRRKERKSVNNFSFEEVLLNTNRNNFVIYLFLQVYKNSV